MCVIRVFDRKRANEEERKSVFQRENERPLINLPFHERAPCYPDFSTLAKFGAITLAVNGTNGTIERTLLGGKDTFEHYREH